METHSERTFVIKTYSDERVPGWLVEKTISEAIEKIWRHTVHGDIQAEVISVSRPEIKVTNKPEPTLEEAIGAMFEAFASKKKRH